MGRSAGSGCEVGREFNGLTCEKEGSKEKGMLADAAASGYDVRKELPGTGVAGC